MKFENFEVGIITGCAASAISVLVGPLDGVIVALLCFMAVDYLTGTISGAIAHELSSATGWKGLLKKVLTLLIVCIVHIGEVYLLGSSGHVLRDGVCAFYIGNEGLSILENMHECGVKYPAKIEKLFESWRDSNDHDE